MNPRLLLIVLPVIVGCGEEDRTPSRFTPAVEKNVLTTDDTTPPLREVATAGLRPQTPPPVNGAVAAAFAAYPGSSIGGIAAVEADGAQTRIDLRLDGGLPGAHYQGAVRLGRCAAVGSRIAMLNPVSAGQGGGGRSVSYISVPIDSLRSAPHLLLLGRDGRSEACAELGAGGSD